METTNEMTTAFPHLDSFGKAHMVNVTAKPTSRRVARARARVRTESETARSLATGTNGFEDALSTARVAAIFAAKRTPSLIPLAHSLLIGDVEVDFQIDDHGVGIETAVSALDRTGVEMEALVAASVAALSLYESCRAAGGDAAINELTLWEKTGGRSGHWIRQEPS